MTYHGEGGALGAFGAEHEEHVDERQDVDGHDEVADHLVAHGEPQVADAPLQVHAQDQQDLVGQIQRDKNHQHTFIWIRAQSFKLAGCSTKLDSGHMEEVRLWVYGPG